MRLHAKSRRKLRIGKMFPSLRKGDYRGRLVRYRWYVLSLFYALDEHKTRSMSNCAAQCYPLRGSRTLE